MVPWIFACPGRCSGRLRLDSTDDGLHLNWDLRSAGSSIPWGSCTVVQRLCTESPAFFTNHEQRASCLISHLYVSILQLCGRVDLTFFFSTEKRKVKSSPSAETEILVSFLWYHGSSIEFFWNRNALSMSDGELILCSVWYRQSRGKDLVSFQRPCASAYRIENTEFRSFTGGVAASSSPEIFTCSQLKGR